MNFTLEGRCLEIGISNIYLEHPLSIPSCSILLIFPLWDGASVYFSSYEQVDWIGQCDGSVAGTAGLDTYTWQISYNIFLSAFMGLVLRTCLSLIPGNHKSWLLVITKHKCSCSTYYGPVRLPGHFFLLPQGVLRSASPSDLFETAGFWYFWKSAPRRFKDVHASFGLLLKIWLLLMFPR